MVDRSLDEVAALLPPDAEQLFTVMVEHHLSLPAGSDRVFHTIRLAPGTRMMFPGPGGDDSDFIDETALRDLYELGLVRMVMRGRNSDQYEISATALAFYRHLVRQRGQAVDHIAVTATQLVDGQEFSRRHAGAASHLNKACDLLADDRVDDQLVAELGAHLRGALMDVVGGLQGAPAMNPEKLVDRFEAWSSGRLHKREAAALAAMLDRSRSLSQRLAHIREERSMGEPLRGWEELRRAVFLVTVCCYEIDRAGQA